MAKLLQKGIFKNAWFSQNQIYSMQIAYISQYTLSVN